MRNSEAGTQAGAVDLGGIKMVLVGPKGLFSCGLLVLCGRESCGGFELKRGRVSPEESAKVPLRGAGQA